MSSGFIGKGVKVLVYSDRHQSGCGEDDGYYLCYKYNLMRMNNI